MVFQIPTKRCLRISIKSRFHLKNTETRYQVADDPSSPALQELLSKLDQLISVIERAVPPIPVEPDAEAADAFVWDPDSRALQPVHQVNRVDLSMLKGIDRNKDLLVDNTRLFTQGLPANNVLLWGARGMGKSSLVKAAHAYCLDRVAAHRPDGRLKLIEIHREDINSLPTLMNIARKSPHRFILFCDDLSFDEGDASYKSLKAALEGGIEGRPDNVIFYATSNRRHLLPRDMIDNEKSSAINPGDAIQEKVSLSDRFGLWIGFHNASQDDYLEMVRGYANQLSIPIQGEDLKRQALEWSTTRGSRSGRVAWQFIQHLAGRAGMQTASD